MRCQNCGNEVPEGFQFCGHCGDQITPEEASRDSSSPPQPGEFDEDAETTLDIHPGEQIPSQEFDKPLDELEFDEDAATMLDVQQAEQKPDTDPAKTDRDESHLEIKVGIEDMLTGQTLGPYRFTEKLGRGGMATVYKAYESGLDRYVAVKVMRQYLTSDPEFKTRFQREAKAIARLDHHNIMPVYSYGEEQGLNFIATRYVDGGTLKEIMGKPMSLEQTVKIISGVARALGYAHQRGVVHRDVKPANVLLASGDWPLLADFGLARMMEGVTHVTQTGVGMGTPTYMSPEQGEGKEIDGRSDIYSLGIMLYEMLTGEAPFQADTPVGVVVQHITAPLPLPRKINPDIPEAMERVILKAVAKNPQDRYQTTDELIGDMEKVLAGMPVKALPTSTEKSKPRAKWLWAVLGLMLVTIAVISVFQFVLPEMVPSIETIEVTAKFTATEESSTTTPIPQTPTSVPISTGSISGEVIMSDPIWEGHKFYIYLTPLGDEIPIDQTALDAPGFYQFTGIEPGEYTIDVVLDMDNSGSGEPTSDDIFGWYEVGYDPKLTLEAGQELDEIDISLTTSDDEYGQPEPSPTVSEAIGSISGTVNKLEGCEDGGSYPIEVNASVFDAPPGPSKYAIWLQEPGEYVIPNIEPGKYWVFAIEYCGGRGPGPTISGDLWGQYYLGPNSGLIVIDKGTEIEGIDLNLERLP